MKVKWDRELSGYLRRNIKKEFDETKIIVSNYRPYFRQYFYFDRNFNGMTYQWFDFYRKNNFLAFTVPGVGSPKDFHTLAIDTIIDLNALPAGGQTIPLYYFDKKNQKNENITDWGLTQFQNHYKASNGAKITKQDIFY